MNPRILLLGVIITAVVQTGLLVNILTNRAEALKTGQEVRLETGFVDPRDLFRGHYTRLNLLINTVPKTKLDPLVAFQAGDDAYAELETTGDFATVHKLWKTYPRNTKRPVLKGTYNYSRQNDVRVDFAITRFYADKKRALELENLERDGKLGVILSISPKGDAMIKGLSIEGHQIYEEPLY